MNDLLQKQADLIDKILKYTQEQQDLIYSIRNDLKEYEDSLREIMSKVELGEKHE